jgi:Fe-S-cluster-containing dehydrogenase component
VHDATDAPTTGPDGRTPTQGPGRADVGELFPDRDDVVFIIDQSRCIGCNACVAACAECGTHRGESMIHLDHVDRGSTVQTVPMVCMHCEDPTCAEVCPADAIKQTEDGVVQTSSTPRCIGCSNCVNACPFGVPKYMVEIDQMMKCDMCYDRTSEGLAPMCATVCPSEALWYGTRAEFEERRTGQLLADWKFGTEHVSTKVATVVDDREPGPLDVLLGRDPEFRWQDDPFGLEGHG